MRDKKNQKLAERDFNSFINDLKIGGLEFEIIEENEIKKNCLKGLYNRAKEVLFQVNPEELLLFVFRDKKTQACWSSEDYSGSVIINMAYNLEISELKKARGEAREKVRQELDLVIVEPET